LKYSITLITRGLLVSQLLNRSFTAQRIRITVLPELDDLDAAISRSNPIAAFVRI
jgi:hypothetical protein